VQSASFSGGSPLSDSQSGWTKTNFVRTCPGNNHSNGAVFLAPNGILGHSGAEQEVTFIHS
jgi:hypothetical protein